MSVSSVGRAIFHLGVHNGGASCSAWGHWSPNKLNKRPSAAVFRSCAGGVQRGTWLTGKAGDRLVRNQRYPSDPTDAEWAIVRDAMAVPRWMEGIGGQPEGTATGRCWTRSGSESEPTPARVWPANPWPPAASPSIATPPPSPAPPPGRSRRPRPAIKADLDRAARGRPGLAGCAESTDSADRPSPAHATSAPPISPSPTLQARAGLAVHRDSAGRRKHRGRCVVVSPGQQLAERDRAMPHSLHSCLATASSAWIRSVSPRSASTRRRAVSPRSSRNPTTDSIPDLHPSDSSGHAGCAVIGGTAPCCRSYQRPTPHHAEPLSSPCSVDGTRPKA